MLDIRRSWFWSKVSFNAENSWSKVSFWDLSADSMRSIPWFIMSLWTSENSSTVARKSRFSDLVGIFNKKSWSTEAFDMLGRYNNSKVFSAVCFLHVDFCCSSRKWYSLRTSEEFQNIVKPFWTWAAKKRSRWIRFFKNSTTLNDCRLLLQNVFKVHSSMHLISDASILTLHCLPCIQQYWAGWLYLVFITLGSWLRMFSHVIRRGEEYFVLLRHEVLKHSQIQNSFSFYSQFCRYQNWKCSIAIQWNPFLC